jgi:hypothetical protein
MGATIYHHDLPRPQKLNTIRHPMPTAPVPDKSCQNVLKGVLLLLALHFLHSPDPGFGLAPGLQVWTLQMSGPQISVSKFISSSSPTFIVSSRLQTNMVGVPCREVSSTQHLPLRRPTSPFSTSKEGNGRMRAYSHQPFTCSLILTPRSNDI